MTNINPFTPAPGSFAAPAPAPSTWGAPPDAYAPSNPFAAPASAPPPLAAAAQQPFAYQQGWQPARTPRFAWPDMLVLVVLPIAFLAMVVIAGQGSGVGRTTTSALLAFVPLLIVLTGVRWIDRLEPEPRSALLFALLWGGGVAAASSYYVNSWTNQTLAGIYGLAKAELMTVTVAAPVIEELTKGLCLVLIFVFRPAWIDGLVDGLVYGMMVGAGFAFTENILYFTNASLVESMSSGSQMGLLGLTFFVRGVMSPFAHALFTGVLGLAVGWVAARGQRHLIVLAAPLGVLVSIGLHMLWNTQASGPTFFISYITTQFPILLIAFAVVLWLRGRESAILRQRLAEFGQAGWFDANEVQMVSSLRLRRAALQWARQIGGSEGVRAMRTFQRNATDLAYTRNRLIHGRLRGQEKLKQDTLLDSLQLARQQLHAATVGHRR